MKKGNIWVGLSSLFTFLLVFSIIGTNTAMYYAGTINGALGISTSKVIESEDTKNDVQYYKSSYGDLNSENLLKLIDDTHSQTIQEMIEGAVLLKNDNDTLPLKEDENAISLFGHATVQPLYRNNSAGSIASNTEEGIDLYEALKNDGLSINETLYSAYLNSTTNRSMVANFMTGEESEYSFGEENISFYSDKIKDSWENDFNDVAIITIARQGGEGNELYMEDYQGVSQLALHQEEKDLLQMIKDSGKFKKTILLINSGNPLEVGWLNEYDIDACLWIGCPGEKGFIGVSKLLIGEENPSGHLTDTYAVNSLSSPATVNNSYNNQEWSNYMYVEDNSTDLKGQASYYATQVEGIYVGYKYYETRYEDTVIDRFNASSNVGSSNNNNWNYNMEVSYPFGYGLSYTTFEQSLDSVEINEDEITVNVTVKNTGNVAGKSVIQVYAQTPYGEYELANKVEKSAIQLLNFGKTDIILPSESQSISIKCDPYLLASYDYTKSKGYIISEGDYFISIGNEAHDALNNILAIKGYENTTNIAGEVIVGDKNKVFSWYEKFNNTKFKTEENGVVVTNQFDDCDLNYWLEDSVTYLSRSDWGGTYPKEPIKAKVTEEMMYFLNGNTYVKPENSLGEKDFVQGEVQGIPLVTMMGVDYNDSLWETFINQLTINEMANLVADNYGTDEITSISKPQAVTGDGPDGIGGTITSFSKEKYGIDAPTNCYTAQIVLGSTFNKELMANRGELMGEEALFLGIVENWGPGVNLHRTPFGGRNFEYFSEDANMSYLCTIPVVEAFQENGVSAGAKHVAGNDQENNREGIACFFNEQAFREGALRGAEGAVKVAKGKSVMSAYNRLGLTNCSSSYALNTQVIRNEWGFLGHIETDAIVSAVEGYKSNYTTNLVSGTDSFCLDFSGESAKAIKAAIYLNDDGTLLEHLRRASKNILYVVANSNIMNGYNANTKVEYITPWWYFVCYGTIILFSFIDLFSIIMIYLTKRKSKNSLYEEIKNE
ncbi:MAG: glycoside hydrolase family 3 C-terminal domain-containing protein [Lachnospirales bacterium]